MADPGRLDELKRKFDDNPRRYFAPLANEYRKAGDSDLAIELCRTYLPQQPAHMSGYIVYGQALHDSGRPDEAEAVFKQALALDPENIIALRQLGDIARDSGDSTGAMRWYTKVLELDPRNEEISAYITSLAHPGSRPEPAATSPERPAPPTVRPEPAPDESAVSLGDIVSEPDSAQAPIAADTPAPAAGPTHQEPAWDEQIPDDPMSDEPFEVTEWPAALESSPDAFAGVWGDEMDGFASTASSDETGESEQPRDLAHRDAEQTSAADEPEYVEQREPQPEHQPENQPEHQREHQPFRESQTATTSPFVTETMAELYTRQGLHGEALTIYRELVVRRDDPELRRKIAELEARQKPQKQRETVRDFFERIGAQRPNERVERAVERAAENSSPAASPLASLFQSSPSDAADLGAAQRLAGAFGKAPTDDSQS